MRRPSNEQNEGDLNRLTTSASIRSTESLNSSQTIIRTNNDSNNNKNNSSNYLPNIIIVNAEYQQCRKRKDRQDSISSLTQDRKLVRSNSEEHVPNCQGEVIRRVSSHEDFKKPSPLQEHIENDGNVCNEEQTSIKDEINNHQSTTNDLTLSKIKLIDVPSTQAPRLASNGDMFDYENERRRNSERFLKTKSPSGRKSPRKSSKRSSPQPHEKNDGKYDRYSSKNDKRGFASTNDDESDDENLPKVPAARHFPWENPDEKPVVCQRFADNTFDHVHHSITKFIKQDHDLVKFSIPIDDTAVIDPIDKAIAKPYRSFTNAENLKTRDLMQKSHSPIGVYQTPDERVRQINKRLSSLKKKITAYEENFENNYGYRPSQADKTSDKSIKNYISEIHKLRKEKTQIKTDPIAAMGYKNKFDDSVPAEKKLIKVKDSLLEIEKRLQEKRTEDDRNLLIEEMSPDQLIEEKTSVQRALLYFESLYGRPGTSDERDAARPLYDRYRHLKRLVNRNNSVSGAIPELPTILENEALALSGMVTPSTDFSPPSINSVVQSPSDSSTSTSIDTNPSVTSGTALQENFRLHSMTIQELYSHFDTIREEKKQLRRAIKEFEHNFEEVNGRKMLKSDRNSIDETYSLYKQKKAKLRLLDALVKKQMTN